MKSKIYSLLRYVRAGAAVLVGVLSVAAVMGQFYPIKIFDVQLVALLQRVLVDFSFFAVFLLAGMFLLTFLFGRVYCPVLCPLGLWQEFFMLFSRRKILMQRSHAFKYFLAAVVFGALVGGSAFLVRKIDPYSLFASGMSGAWWGMFVLVFLAALSMFKGRIFCTNVCPVGAVLGLMSKHALNKVYIEKNYIDEAAKEPDLISPHNIYLHILVESGIIGTVAFFSLLAYQLKKAYQYAENDNLMQAYLSALIGMSVHGLVDYLFLVKIYYQFYWFMSGCIFLYLKQNYQNNKDKFLYKV